MTCKFVYFPLSHPHNHFQLHSNPAIISSSSLCQCALTKQGLRFLSTLSVKAGDSSAAAKLIGKFVASSPKSISLNALSHLLSPDTTHPHLALHSLPLYLKIKEASWFEYNPKLVAALAALLDKQGKSGKSEALILEAAEKLSRRHRELAMFYCNLVDSHAKQGSERGFDRSCAHVSELLRSSSSNYIKCNAFESLIGGLCTVDRPREAEGLMEEMKTEGLKPTVFEFRSVIYGYGRAGLLDDMLRIADQMASEGLAIDTSCSNMVLSSYGIHNELPRMVLWLRNMRGLGVPFSIRTYNSVLKWCPGVSVMLQDSENVPLSVEELGSSLKGDEALLVKELVGSGVLEEVMVWASSEAKLDLHGMHLGTAYLIMLEWMEEMRRRLSDENSVVPVEVVVVCGSGKHSNVRGVSPVKLMIKEMMLRMRSPMKVDRKNSGCFTAKGKTVKGWLCRDLGRGQEFALPHS